MKITVLDLDTLGNDLDLSPLTSLGECEFYPSTRPEDLGARLAESDVAIINKIKMTRPVLEAAPKLKLICVAATGYDNIDLAACREKGIGVCNVPGYSTESVAMVTFTLALNLMSHLPEFSRFVCSGKYTASGLPNCLTPSFHDLCGKTWGIVGYGNIGRKVAQVAEAFGCKVLYYRAKADENACDIDTLCRRSDIISLHCPLNDGTRNLISRERLALMKPGAILVNTARGAVCDEAAVADAILSGQLGAFGCDVYAQEPFPADHPYRAILGRDNVCLTPHIAWASFEARTKVVQEMGANIAAFTRGEMRNRVELL